MFDLESELTRWRRKMAAGGLIDPTVLRELESHLRDHIEHQLRAGVELSAAFQSGVQRLGEPDALRHEFARARGFIDVRLLARLRRGWARLAASVAVGVIFFAWHARVTPLYRATTTVEFQKPVASSAAPNGAPPEALATALQILSSAQLRAKVAASFTAEETRAFTATTSAALVTAIPGRDDIDPAKIQQTRTVREDPTPPLGQFMARTQRLSSIVHLSIDHPDAAAAARIANRYVTAWRDDFAESPTLAGANLRVIDPATPPPRPISPNYPALARTASLAALATFVILSAIVFLLGKLLRPRADREQLATS